MKLIKIWEADIVKAYDLQNSFLSNENGFTNEMANCSFEDFKKYLVRKEESSRGVNLKEGYVEDTTYILMNDDGEYVGLFNLRHRLNEFLKNGPGHIGYGIRKEYRNKGYASRGLELLINLAKDIIKEDEIYLSVHKDNLPSLKVQLKNGAYIHHQDDKEYFTRIKK